MNFLLLKRVSIFLVPKIILIHIYRQYLPEVLSGCSLDAAIGFTNLASCHMMEFDLTPTINYLKLSKNFALSLWKMHRLDHKNDFIAAANVGPVVVHSIMKNLQLTLTSFNSDGNLGEAV